MADPNRTPRLPPHHPSFLRHNPTITPQDLLIATKQDPQAVLEYINNLEHENMRLRHEMLSSRDEMFTVVQNSLSAIANHVSQTLGVTKGSLIDIQKNFIKIGFTRNGNDADFVKPAVLRRYQEGDIGNQATKKEAAIAGIFNKSLEDLLTSPYSPTVDYFGGSHLPLSPKQKANVVNYTTTKPGSGLGSMFNPFGGQAITSLPPLKATTPKHAPISTIAETFPVQANSRSSVLASPEPQSSKVDLQPRTTPVIGDPSPFRFGTSPALVAQSQKQVETPITTAGLAVRSESQQNVRKLDSKAATDEFLAYMVESHKQPRSYGSITQPWTRSGTELSSDTYVSAVESFDAKNEDTTFTSTFVRSSGPLIKYDLDFLKKIGVTCKKQANPFQGNKDEELKPVIEWEGDKYTKSLRLPLRRFSRGGSRPTDFA